MLTTSILICTHNYVHRIVIFLSTHIQLVIQAGNFYICNLLLQSFKNSELTTTLCTFLCFSIVVVNSCAYSQRMVNILKTTKFSMQRHSFITYSQASYPVATLRNSIYIIMMLSIKYIVLLIYYVLHSIEILHD